MPNSPEKNVSLYHDDQVAAYQAARDRLEAREVDVDDLSEGDVLAALSRDYVDAVNEPPNADSSSTAGEGAGYWDVVGDFAPAVVLVVWVLAVGFVAGIFLL